MADTFLQGIESAYIDGVYCPTTEQVTYSLPQELRAHAESNNGPLSNVYTWNKEAGQIQMTIVHYANFDYAGLFTNTAVHQVTLNGRSGNQLIASGCVVNENPTHNLVNGTTEVTFTFVDANITYV